MGRKAKASGEIRHAVSVMLTGGEIAALEAVGGTVNRAVQGYARLLLEGGEAAPGLGPPGSVRGPSIAPLQSQVTIKGKPKSDGSGMRGVF